MVEFIDFHTHQIRPKKETIFELYCHTDPGRPLPALIEKEERAFTVGLHPWFLDNNFNRHEPQKNNQWLALEKLLSSNHCVGLGECGLDRLKGPGFELQQKVLEIQLHYARDHKIPLVIFHCVRAYPECLSQIKRSRFSGKVVFHDFGGNLQIAKALLENANCFLSLGSALNREHFVKNVLPGLDINRLLLETDDDKTITIESRYRQLSEALNCSLQDVSTILRKNASEVLGHQAL